MIDADAQGSLTASLGFTEPDSLEVTLATIMGNLINDGEVEPGEGILHHEEGIDLMPGNIELSGLEVSLVNVMSRETVLRSYIEIVRENYDYILIDCMPSLGMITINAFASADSILIPVQAAYLPVKGLQQLIKTVGKVKRQINPKLEIEGILLTMVDSRTNYAKDISAMLKEAYGSRVRIFANVIPISVRAAEISAEGVSIYKHDPKGKVASAYRHQQEAFGFASSAVTSPGGNACRIWKNRAPRSMSRAVAAWYSLFTSRNSAAAVDGSQRWEDTAPSFWGLSP